MKYHFGFKALAFILAACALVAGLGSVYLIVGIVGNGLYTSTPEEVYAARTEYWGQDQTYDLANRLLRRYTATQLGECNQNTLSYVGLNFTVADLSRDFGIEQGSWDYTIADLNGQSMQSNQGTLSGELEQYVFHLQVEYPVLSTEAVNHTHWNWRDYYYTETEEYFLYYYNSPTYQVTIRALPGTFTSSYPGDLGKLELLYAMRYWAIAALGASLLVFVLCAVYLCCAAGRSHRHDEVQLKGLTKLPLDVYGAAAIFGAAVLAALGIDLLDNLLWSDTLYIWGIAGSGGLLLAAALVAGIWLYAVVAQFKMKNGSWWRRSLIGWLLRLLWRGLKCLGRGIRFIFRAVKRMFDLLPLIWQWLLTAAAMVIVPLFCLFLCSVSYGFFRFLFALWLMAACLLDIAMVCYGAYAFGILYKGAKQMAQGDLNAKVPTQYLFGAFRAFAGELNRLADAAMEAARGQMKSERMKSELITNVSHDIKTPLTSIINYVDLLQKPHTEEEGQQYLEVLSRQSGKLKKLIDDLMDMSKADSGAMQVEIGQVDAEEMLQQALGEFSDKLAEAGLTVVFHKPEEPVPILADGRLAWRVMSNLLGNTVKYALPGTRMYVDLTRIEDRVQISLKNISRQELNVSADELLERFVRGDESRNTEGNGLGLNIARSLMEVQKGSLELYVDGDLFKVVLTLPKA